MSFTKEKTRTTFWEFGRKWTILREHVVGQGHPRVLSSMKEAESMQVEWVASCEPKNHQKKIKWRDVSLIFWSHTLPKFNRLPVKV